MAKTPTASLEVWGDPVAHSRSPQLHRAAYKALGLNWSYERRQVSEASFDREFVAAKHSVHGLSLTMPLKTKAFDVATWRDPRALRTGVANTLLMSDSGPRAFNTDIGGLVRAFHENGVEAPTRARLVGAGSTAISAVVALAESGVRELEVLARSPHRAVPLIDHAADMGMHVSVRAADDVSGLSTVDLTVATLPGGAELDPSSVAALAHTGGSLVDVVYSPWPTQLASAWATLDAPVASGLDMLLYQAVLQVRIFVTGSVTEELDDEAMVTASMRAAVMGD